MPFKRLFIAIKIISSEELKNCFNSLKFQLKHENVVFSDINQLHLTLLFFGKTDEIQIPEINKVLNCIASNSLPFNLEINHIGTFGKKKYPKTLWIGVNKNPLLLELKTKINNEFLKEKKVITESPDFIPHITLARIKHINNVQDFYSTVEKYKDFFKYKLYVDKFHLFESTLTPQGAIYNILNTFILNQKIL